MLAEYLLGRVGQAEENAVMLPLIKEAEVRDIHPVTLHL
jgi:hypothetical protein